jgi:hypothetical protein
VLRHHLESDEFSFSLSRPDAYVLAAKGGRLIGDVVASRYDGMTRTESLVHRKKQNPIIDADESTDVQGAARIA